LKDAILLRKIVGRMTMGPGIVKQAPTIVRITAAANRTHPGGQHKLLKNDSHLDYPSGSFY
jgi:hypothetical protein